MVKLLYKSGDPNNLSNFWPITLLQCSWKVKVTRTKLYRISHYLIETEDEWQTGFRKSYSVADNTHCVKQIIVKYEVRLYLCFIDTRKTFSRVDWIKTWNSLIDRGVPRQLLQRLYEASSTNILVNGSKIYVPIRRGARQGDGMSRELFNSVLAYAVNNTGWDQAVLKTNGEQLPLLAYLVIFAKSRPELEKMLVKLTDILGKVGFFFFHVLKGIPAAENV